MTTNNIKQNMCYEWRSISAPLMAHVVLLVLQNLLLIMNTDRSGCYNGKRIPAVFVKHELRNVYPLVTRPLIDSIAFLLPSALCQEGNPHTKWTFLNLASTERYAFHIQVLLQFCYIKIET